MVRDAKLSSRDFLKTFLFNVKKEQDDGILTDAFLFASVSVTGWTPLNLINELAE